MKTKSNITLNSKTTFLGSLASEVTDIMSHRLITACIWFLVLCALFVFDAPLAQLLFLLIIPLQWSWLVLGAVIAFFALVTARYNLKRDCVILIICLVGFALYFSNLGFVMGRHALFQIRKSTYVEQLAASQELGFVPAELGMTNDGEPPLYGFFWQRGMLDNFSLAVYDPTGNIGKINDCETWDSIHLSKLSKLFGGTYHHCQEMGDGWYICWFT